MRNKKQQIIETIDFPGRYRVVAVDSSYLRPGFAVLELENNRIFDVKLSNVNNKTNEKERIVKCTKPRGEVLDEILNHFCHLFPDDGIPTYFVRERAFNSRGSNNEIAVFEVLAVLDWFVWRLGSDWHEIFPVTVKKQITGSGKADKEQVAKALEQYVGALPYACDDESDAVAVGIAWLIQHNVIKTAEAKAETSGKA